MEQQTSLWLQDSNLQQFVQYDAKTESVMISIFDVLLLSRIKNKASFHQKVYDEAKEKEIFYTNIDRHLYIKLRMEIDRQAFRKLTNDSFQKQDELDDFPKFLLNKIQLLEVEYNLLLQNVYANPVVVDFMQYLKASKRKVILVDSCLYSKVQIEQLLKTAGLTSEVYDELVIINGVADDFAEKLFDYSGIIHIKNNKEYRIFRDKTNSIVTISYHLLEKSLLNSVDIEDLLYEDADQQFYMLRKVLCQQYRVKQNPYFAIGCLNVGPLLSAFIYNTYNNIKTEKRKVVLPLMREGELLSEMLDVLLREKEDSFTVVKPFYVSRKATYLPTASQHSLHDIINFFESIHIPVKALYSFLEIELNYKVTPYLESNLYQLKMNDFAGYEIVIQSITRTFDAKKFEHICMQKKRLLQTYLQQMTGVEAKIATVDIGFNGTIQKNLEKINDDSIWDFKHYIIFSREAVVTKLLEGINIDTFVNLKDRHSFLSDIIRSVDVFEQMVIGLSGTTLDYKEQDGEIVPICDEPVYTKQEVEARNSIKEGILFFFHIYLQLQKHNVFQKVDTHALAYMVHRLIKYPLPSEAKALMKLSYSTNFGHNTMYPLIESQHLQDYSEDITLLDNVAQGSYLSTGICWPQGLWTLLDREFIVKNLPDNSQIGYVKTYISKVLNVIEKENIAIYGAGEIGSQLIETMQMLAKQPAFIIDRNKVLNGSYLGGCKIISPEQAVSRKIDTIIIASITFAEQIEQDIKQLFRDSFNKLQIIRLDL